MKYLIVANWKCNPPTLKEAEKLFSLIREGVKNIKNAEVIVCPPFIYIARIQNTGYKIQDTRYKIRIGAQDCFWENPPTGGGAFTGEISPAMLKNLAVKYAIIGHSERRKYQKETDEMVNKKLKAALKAGLTPILCVGSKKRGEKGNQEMKVQLESALTGIKRAELEKIVFTYEPVWAISTTKRSIVATPENTKGEAIFIRKILTKLFDKTIAQKARVIYGGSVDNTNIRDFIEKAQMDGVLIGAASLRPDDFIAAVKKVDASIKFSINSE